MFLDLILTVLVTCISETCMKIKIDLNFYFHTASKGFMKAFKAFIKPFEAPQRSAKIKIQDGKDRDREKLSVLF